MPSTALIRHIVPLIAGIGISLIYHAGLWWTVKALAASGRPVLLSMGSFYLRMAVTVTFFYFVMNNDWQRLAACVFGFMIVKFLITRAVSPEKKPLMLESK